MPIACVTKRCRLAASPPANTPSLLVAPRASVQTSAPSARSGAQRRELRVLADRRDHRVGLEHELAARDERRVDRPLTFEDARARNAASRLCCSALAVAQHRAVDEHHAFVLRLEHLLALRRHLRLATPARARSPRGRRGARCARRPWRRCRRRSPRGAARARAACRRSPARGRRRRPRSRAWRSRAAAAAWARPRRARGTPRRSPRAAARTAPRSSSAMPVRTSTPSARMRSISPSSTSRGRR